ncbi:hypothetical protein N2152v2_005563 [Parachlorella kessleri]
MYPILNLRLFRQDLHWYLRSLEEVIIRALAEVSGLKGERIQGLTGVWVGGSKVAAIGVRASRWVTYHGLALNVAMDLTPFQQIVPCGIADRGVTSVEQLLAGLERQTGEAHGEITEQGSTAAAAGLDAALLETGVALATAATEAHERQQLLEEYRHGLLEAFEEVFGVELRPDAWESLKDSYNDIRVALEGPVATITLHRPEALNALNTNVMSEVVSAAMFLDRELPSVKTIIITGSGKKAFAAGADIKEMSTISYADAYNKQLLNGWDTLRNIRKPIIAAVNGYALGGGCELAMMCDIIIASDNASFGQPEITLGVIPGMGGTQRLTRAVGKSRAMEMILTGARISAAEAAKIGLISRVVPQDELLPEVKKVAQKIAEYSLPVVSKAKEAVNIAHEMSLQEGLRFEKREFWSCWSLDDQKEGMAAFVQKRKPDFKNK